MSIVPWHLALFATPKAIREHFEGADEDPTQGLSDEVLREVGEAVVTDYNLYDAFHDALLASLDQRQEGE